MRRAARFGLWLAAAGPLPLVAGAQTVPVPVIAVPRPDSLKKPPPTFVADTARPALGVTPEPTDTVTRRSGWRIGAVIVVLTLTTLLLYNVRSR